MLVIIVERKLIATGRIRKMSGIVMNYHMRKSDAARRTDFLPIKNNNASRTH